MLGFRVNMFDLPNFLPLPGPLVPCSPSPEANDWKTAIFVPGSQDVEEGMCGLIEVG